MVAEYLDSLHVEAIGGGKFKLLDEFRYYSPVYGGTIIVPQGFITDFDSVPRLPVVYMAVANVAQRAAVIHDYLYSKQLTSRRLADNVFYEAMRVDSINIFRAYSMWLGLRFAGWKRWDEIKREQESLLERIR